MTNEGNLLKSGGTMTIALIEKDNQLLISNVRYSREKEVKLSSNNTFKDDRDGHVYKTITIGTQTWLAENLAYKYNGGGCYAYNNDEKYVDLYGYLYDWSSANESCPIGWHIPSTDEWSILFNNLGGNDIAGGKLKATINWESPNKGATNSSGFSALPGGMRYHGGDFGSREGYGYWWSSTKISNDEAWAIEMDYNGEYVTSSNHYMINGLSVRCIKNN